MINDRYYNGETEIDLIDMMFYLMRKWRTLILAIVIGAIAGCGLYVINRPALVSGETENLYENYQVDPTVKGQMETAYRYRQLYDQQVEYSQKSLLMQMDPGAVYTGALEYYVSAGENTRLLGERLLNILNGSEFLTELKEAAGLDCEEQYLHEIVSASADYDQTTMIYMDQLDADASTKAVITYRIYYMDPVSCEKMLDVIQARVEALIQDYQEIYEGAVFENVNDTVKLIVHTDFQNKQKSCADAINTYLTNIKKLEDAFSDADKEYYDAVYLNSGQTEEENEETALPEQPDQTKAAGKWIGIGTLLGCVLWGGYYLVRYLMDTRIRSAEELQQRYGLQILGRAACDAAPEKGINGWISRMEQRRRGMPDTLAYISAAIEALEAETIILTLDQNDPVSVKLAETLASACTSLTCCNLIHLDGETLVKAKTVDGVVLLAAAGQTDHRQVRRELEVCALQKIPVLGAVVVE